MEEIMGGFGTRVKKFFHNIGVALYATAIGLLAFLAIVDIPDIGQMYQSEGTSLWAVALLLAIVIAWCAEIGRRVAKTDAELMTCAFLTVDVLMLIAICSGDLRWGTRWFLLAAIVLLSIPSFIAAISRWQERAAARNAATHRPGHAAH